MQGVSGPAPSSITSSWYNLALISDTATYSGNTNSYSMLLTQLDTDSQYEVRLRAMNKHGWSSLSEPFLFNTASELYSDCTDLTSHHHLNISQFVQLEISEKISTLLTLTKLDTRKVWRVLCRS